MNSNNDTDPKEAWINKVKERVEANTYSFYPSPSLTIFVNQENHLDELAPPRFGTLKVHM